MAGMPLEERVGAVLLARSWMFCAAESCTGGLLMHLLTNVAGSSAYIAGGAVTYSYEAKQRLLGVRRETLETHGAVSEETAAEMVQGVLSVFGGDIAISITGIAGPGGAMPGKPVGLVYVGIAVPSLNLLRVDRHLWNGNRETNKRLSADAAMQKILDALE